VNDPEPDGGPLVGLMAGLGLLEGEVEAVVAVPCDLPLLHPALVRVLIERLLAADADVACSTAEDGRALALPGAWRVGTTEAIRVALTDGERSPSRLASRLRMAGIALSELKADPELAELDPDLDSLLDIDTAIQLGDLAGRPPKVRVARDRSLETANAWTLGELVDQVGGELDGPCVVNGLPVEFDPRFPLARRDSISLPPGEGL
jgi:molybdopterin-guanine dinucleotide biosynthesis protein A